MNNDTRQLLFALLRSAICGTRFEESEGVSDEQLQELIAIGKKHDIAHLLALGLQKNGMLSAGCAGVEKNIYNAYLRYERTNREYLKLCNILEKAEIPFIPLKGSVLREFYPEPWMRTSCDIDVLVRETDLEKASALLTSEYGYTCGVKKAHDISFFAPNKQHLELHYILVENGVANKSHQILEDVWENAVVKKGYRYFYVMPDELFYYYHISHMAKHFEKGGCGIRPFLDLWIMEKMDNADWDKRNVLLKQGDMLTFAEAARRLSKIWFENVPMDAVSQQMEEFILWGGVYGNRSNANVVQAAKGESKIRFILKMIFLSRKELEMIYPIISSKPMLFPYFQVKRWFRVFSKAKRNKVKLLAEMRNSVTNLEAEYMSTLLKNLGLL